jgi:hypothetical protein
LEGQRFYPMNPSIPFSFDANDLQNINPYHVMDGKWGGWGPSFWRRARGQWGFAQGDVVEWRRVWEDDVSRDEWYRVWIDKDAVWRDLTTEEIDRLPALTRVRPPLEWRPLTSPYSSLDKEALASVLLPSMTEVIGQAPFISEAIKLSTSDDVSVKESTQNP